MYGHPKLGYGVQRGWRRVLYFYSVLLPDFVAENLLLAVFILLTVGALVGFSLAVNWTVEQIGLHFNCVAK